MAFGKLSIGVRVWDGTGPSRAVLGLLSGKPGSSFPRLEHRWQTIRVAPSTRDRPGLPTISLPQTSQYNGCYTTSRRETVEIGSDQAQLAIGNRCPSNQ